MNLSRISELIRALNFAKCISKKYINYEILKLTNSGKTLKLHLQSKIF